MSTALLSTLWDMVAVNRVYTARLSGMLVLGPDGESIGRVRDVVISISYGRQQPRVLGLVVELLNRRRIFVPILRITAIEPSAVTLTTATVSLRRFAQRPGEVLVIGQVLDTRVRVEDPELEHLAGIDVVVVASISSGGSSPSSPLSCEPAGEAIAGFSSPKAR